ncbi:MAG TPA: biotin--[acetyl-CoA-carboxylase] ligase [Dehalococcoidales bacterium]|nr:MAG: biotin--[acetyl-CoA-carboxylase] ligase [Chloroflexi bacterium RBG_16_60_22]HJX14081.1 biotin--[acetyl-CoA-carboxylase] ligase [Dehalococcoidales bacterium]
MSAEIYSSGEIRRGLATSVIGRRVLFYPRLASTMDTARQEAKSGASEGTVIIAGEQTRGRGRLKRPWLSPVGNIALSIILRPDIAGLPCLMMISSLAAVRSIREVAGLKARIKWPNDVLIGGKKAGGILIENEVKGDRVAYAVIGIGINVGLRTADHADIAGIAAGLNETAGREISRAELVRSLLEEFERLYLALPDGQTIYEEWRDNLATLGKKVTATSGKDVMEGIAVSVDGNGALVLRRPDGTMTRVVAGDVTLREG